MNESIGPYLKAPDNVKMPCPEGGEWSHAPVGPAIVPNACPTCSTTGQYVIHADGKCPAETGDVTPTSSNV